MNLLGKMTGLRALALCASSMMMHLRPDDARILCDLYDKRDNARDDAQHEHRDDPLEVLEVATRARASDTPAYR